MSPRPVMTADEAITALTVMRDNVGFFDPVPWLSHPKVRTFKPVKARTVPRCPDCGASPAGKLGTYVHYSTLVQLQECSRCALIWSDAAIDPAVLTEHFERTYKDERYFEQARGPIFRQLARRVDRLTPEGGSVLDIGGGMGHLAAMVRELRPDIRATVLDVSSGSVAYARERFGLSAICGTLRDLPTLASYDVVVCADVLYYVDDIAACWDTLSRITRRALVIRGPDKLPVIRLYQRVRDLFRGPRPQVRIRAFNPEHRFVLGRRYLRSRLTGAGFRVSIQAAHILRPTSRIKRLMVAALRALTVLARRGPSMLVIAVKSDDHGSVP